MRVVKLQDNPDKPVGTHTLTGTASAIRVIVESRDRTTSEVYSTIGVGTNIIEASWRALVDAFEYKLWKDDERWANEGQFQPPHTWDDANPGQDGLASAEPGIAQTA